MMQSPIRTPNEVAEHLGKLRESRGTMVGAFDRQRTLLDHQLTECQALRERHANGERLPAGQGQTPIHITDVIRQQVTLQAQLTQLEESNEADLRELDQAIARCERLHRYHVDGLDILRIQEAEAALELQGYVDRPEARALIERLAMQIAVYAETPEQIRLTRTRIGLWHATGSNGYRFVQESEHPCGHGIGENWALLIGFAPEYRIHNEDEAVAASVAWSLPLDACIYYFAQLVRGQVQPPRSAPVDGESATGKYDDPFQDE